MKKKILSYLSLIRIYQFPKNIFIYAPLFFSGIYDLKRIINVTVAAIVFYLISAVVYIINDIKDVESDRLSEQKGKRPIASGSVSVLEALVLAGILLAGAIGIALLDQLPTMIFVFIFVYLLNNLAYSTIFKKVPVVDIISISLGYVIRVLIGGFAGGIVVSEYLFLTVLLLSLFLATVKRFRELELFGNSMRVSLKKYDRTFLMNAIWALAAMFQVVLAIYTVENGLHSKFLVFTNIFSLTLLFRYLLDVFTDKSETDDPFSLFLRHPHNLFLVILWAVSAFYIINFT